MENYKLLQRLGKGAQGSVHLVENRSDGTKYVMKRIECNDESEANKAFKEAMALHELRHPYICGYKEFFVTWDKDECAMFVCIVMEHYKHGDLGQFLKKQRDKQECLDETLIKKWLGQITEGLVFVHKKKVIHRDLKPSNIFLMEDMSICIGDFGVATIMSDARTKNRTTVGSMNWMAPEVLERPYDERSDVWSLGCILLEIATSGVTESEQTISGKLIEIKHNPQELENMLEEVGKTYSADLVSIIRTMLRKDFTQRPTAEELLEIPYMRECLALSGSVLAEKKRRQSSAPPHGVLPKDRGITPVVEFLRENIANGTCVKQAVEHLASLTKEEGQTLDSTSKRIIVRAMRDYVSEVDVQLCGCNILNNIITTANLQTFRKRGLYPANDDILYSSEIITAIPLAMKAHSGSADLLQAATSLLMALSADEGAAEVIGSAGGLQDILAAMRSFPDNVQLCTTCCNALWSLTVNEDNARIMTEEKGLQDIVRAMKTHFRHADLVEAAAATLLSLSIVDDNLEQMNDQDCAGLLVEAIQRHIKEPKVIKNACIALASLVEPDEESAYRVLMNKRSDKVELAGIPIIVEAYEHHKDNAEVVEAIASLFMELTEYDEILEEMKFLRTHETVLHEMHKRFKDNTEIIKPCEAALSKMTGTKKK